MTLRSLSRIFALMAFAAPVDAQWVLSAEPTLRIGDEANADYQFSRISHLRRLSDGRIMVTSGPDIRFFDAGGKFLSRAGGRGRGPGEFQSISDLIVMPGDSLLTLNVQTIVVLDPAGKFVRQVQPDLMPLASGDWFAEGNALLPNGNLLAAQYAREKKGSSKPTTLFRTVLRYSILDLETSKVTPLHTGGGMAQQYVNGSPIVMPFSPHEQKAVGADRVYVGDNDSTIIHAFDLTGKPLGAFTVADKARPVTPAELEAFRQSQLEWSTRNREPRQVFDQRWSAAPKPKRHPYWSSALVDKTGGLWISAADRWTAFDREGKRLATMTMPSRFTPRDVGIDYVLGVQRDEDGVETIAMYSLRRR
jgi:hypothetical protein